MYRHCIFCSADLGSNEALERFPVGRSLAFDAAKGRLWAVCPGCARWNLAPIEERWEAVEDAERLFHDTRLRVQSENVGLAKLRDGTRLVRIGAALAGEVAAWRYGPEISRRRRRQELREALGTAGEVLAVPLEAAALVAALVFPPLYLLPLLGSQVGPGVSAVLRRRSERRAVATAERAGSDPVVVRWSDLRGAYLVPDTDTGELALRIPALTPAAPEARLLEALRPELPGVDAFTVRGDAARRLLGRALVHVNAPGATPRVLGYALDELARAGSAEEYLARMAEQRTTLEPGRDDAAPLGPDYWSRRARMEGVAPERRAEWRRRAQASMAGLGGGGLVRGLALEMALHDAEERRLLEGELTLLEGRLARGRGAGRHRRPAGGGDERAAEAGMMGRAGEPRAGRRASARGAGAVEACLAPTG